MYAVIENGGKQYRVQPGDIVSLEKMEGDKGASVSLGQVLFLSNANAENPQVWLGKPYVDGAAVQGEIVAQGRGKKIVIVKMKRRKQYRRTQGHRQEMTQVLVTSIKNGSDVINLSESDKQAKLSKFTSPLKPKGPARTTRASHVMRKPADKAAVAKA